jgi:hypothetical protein
MYCYCVNNKINNKKYIGVSENNVIERFKVHQRDITKGSQLVFHRAVRKYGFNNFEFEWIKDYTNQCNKEELFEIEKYYIFKHNTYINFENSNGYNMTLGGEGGNTHSHKVYQYNKQTLRLINSFNSAVEASKLTGVDFSAILKNCKHIYKSAGSFIWCFEGELPRKYINNNQCSVRQYNRYTLELINEFDTILDAEKKTKVDYRQISACCLNKIKTAGNFIWTKKGNTPNRFIDNSIVSVNQYDKNTLLLIKTFNSIKDAKIKTGINHISSCINGKSKTAGGYVWKRA